ncbi:MAG: hypothetical protein ACYC3S_13225 [Chloroflexota bacterium]
MSKREEDAAAQGWLYPAMGLPSHSLSRSEGLLGLAVPREVCLQDGRIVGWVWLLGLVEIVPPPLQAELESAHADLDNIISVPLGTNRLGVTRAIITTEETAQSVKYKQAAARVGKLRARQEAAIRQAKDSQPGTPGLQGAYEQPTYRYVAPLTQVEVFDWREQSLVLERADELNEWYKAHILGNLTRAAHRPALLSVEDKRHVLAAIVHKAQKDGTPWQALGLRDAADYLEYYCARPQPYKVAGRSLCLPSPLEDRDYDRKTLTKRKVERLRQWLQDIFKHKRWTEAKQQLL